MTNQRKKITVLTACYNEEGNVYSMYKAVKDVFKDLPYDYEHVFADNRSTDRTGDILREIASEDKNVKVIYNNRNFGPTRSGGHALLQCFGDAVITIPCDFQDPPEMIPAFIDEWENGWKVVLGRKAKSRENIIMRGIRKLYYVIMKHLADSDHLEDVTGFGIYDKEIIDVFRWMDDPFPYYRGIICDLGYDIKLIDYEKQARRSGRSSYNFMRYLDDAVTGITSSSRAPLRLMSVTGGVLALLCVLAALFYLVYKLIFWDSFNLGLAPLVIGMFFLGSVQLTFIGILGEYVGAVLTKVTKRPMVVERERLNFDFPDDTFTK